MVESSMKHLVDYSCSR